MSARGGFPPWAVVNAKRTLIHDHIDRCPDRAAMGPAVGDGRRAVEEFKEITKYL